MLLLSCGKSTNKSNERTQVSTTSEPATQMREGVRYIADTYPAATLQDVYKSFYQDYFGSEHMVPTKEQVMAYVEYELTHLGSDTMLMPLREPTGWRHRFERVSMALVLDGSMTKEQLAEGFIDAATHPLAGDSAGWRTEWEQIESIALELRPDWTDSLLMAELRWCADSCYGVHHSLSFRTTYHPHYRIHFTSRN